MLAIETSLGATSVAVANLDATPRRVLVRRLPRDRPQAEMLVPLVGDLMAEARMTFEALDRIAVCVGPGGFSSIRTGVAAARGFGLAAEKTVVGATGFRIMAFEATTSQELQDTRFGLAIPAGRKAVFCQCFEGAEAVSEIELVENDAAAAWFAARSVTVTGGPGRAAANGVVQPFGHALDALAPDAAPLALLAPALDPDRDPPNPLYVRPPDAKPQTAPPLFTRRDDDPAASDA